MSEFWFVRDEAGRFLVDLDCPDPNIKAFREKGQAEQYIESTGHPLRYVVVGEDDALLYRQGVAWSVDDGGDCQ